jgi:hypothetical protein
MDKEIEKTVKMNERKQEKAKNEIQGLSKEFLSDKNQGIYNYITKIDKNDIVIYIIIFFGLLFLLNLYEFNMNHLAMIIFTLSIIYYINDMKNVTGKSRMKEIQMKLLTIYPKPKYFYMDSGIVELIFSIKEYRTYNEVVFEKLILQLDFFLKIVSILEKFPEDSFVLLENLKRRKKEILNILQSMILSIPTGVETEVKLDKALKSLHYILNYHEERLRMQSNRLFLKNKPTIDNKYIYSNKGPDSTDELYNNHYNVF